MTEEELSFEEAFAKLEAIMAQLEEGGLELDESVALFKEGMALAQRCEQKLNEAELQVEQVMQNAAGAQETLPFA